MKVIVAGLPKTGTKSVNAALKHLGYNVYDFMESYTYLRKDWEKICLEGGNTEDFRRMFENVDAVTDVPSCYFWDEIHKAFPDAKAAPKDKLLVFNAKEGWAPLCKFLGVEEPKEPFPHKNVRGNIVDDLIAKDPTFIRAKREVQLVICIVGAFLIFGAHKVIKARPFSSMGFLSSPFK